MRIISCLLMLCLIGLCGCATGIGPFSAAANSQTARRVEAGGQSTWRTSVKEGLAVGADLALYGVMAALIEKELDRDDGTTVIVDQSGYYGQRTTIIGDNQQRLYQD